MPQENQNTGVVYQEPRSTDFVAGAESGVIFENRLANGNWKDFLPLTERQKYTWETNSCVTYSALNPIETQIKWLLKNNLIPDESLQELRNEGFLIKVGDSEEVNLSDRFTAKMSGTTKAGNNLQAVVDSIRSDGAVPQSLWDYSQEKGASFQNWDAFWADYYAPIPQGIEDKGKIFLNHFNVSYEWVYITGSPLFTSARDSLRQHLPHAPIQIVSSVGSDWNFGDNLQPCGCGTQHATMAYDYDTNVRIFDHYPPFTKYFAEGYCIPFAMKIVVTPKVSVVPTPTRPEFRLTKTLKMGMHDAQVTNLQECLKYLGFYKFGVFTDYYGYYTQQAVYEFQKAEKIQTPWGEWAQNPLRQVGPLTRNAIKVALQG